MTISTILDTSNPPHVVISDKNVKKLGSRLKQLHSDSKINTLGPIHEGKDWLYVPYEGLDVYFDSEGLQITVKLFRDNEVFDFYFRHIDELGCMVFDDVIEDEDASNIKKKAKRVDSERKREALVTNVLAPALANLGL